MNLTTHSSSRTLRNGVISKNQSNPDILSPPSVVCVSDYFLFVEVFMKNFEDDAVKHKKKSKKSVKKSSHKHDYQYDRTELIFAFANGHWNHVYEKCAICGKEKSRLVIDKEV